MGILASGSAGGIFGEITVGSSGSAYGYADPASEAGAIGSITHSGIIFLVQWSASSPSQIQAAGFFTFGNIGQMVLNGVTINFASLTNFGGIYGNGSTIVFPSALPTSAGTKVPYQLIGVPGI